MKNKSVSLILLLSVFVLIAGDIVLKKYESETLVNNNNLITVEMNDYANYFLPENVIGKILPKQIRPSPAWTTPPHWSTANWTVLNVN